MRNQIAKKIQSGQGMTEYIVIVALVAVAAIGVYKFFGQTIRSQMSGIASEVAGKSATEAISAAGTAAQGAAGERKEKGLDSYGNGGGGGGAGAPAQ